MDSTSPVSIAEQLRSYREQLRELRAQGLNISNFKYAAISLRVTELASQLTWYD